MGIRQLFSVDTPWVSPRRSRRMASVGSAADSKLHEVKILLLNFKAQIKQMAG